MKVTTDDLLDALRQALTQPGGEEGETVAEMAARTGLAVSAIRKGLGVLIAKGEWEALRVKRTDISGRSASTPAYRIKR